MSNQLCEPLPQVSAPIKGADGAEEPLRNASLLFVLNIDVILQ
jgi:hypothetical protein